MTGKRKLTGPDVPPSWHMPGAVDIEEARTIKREQMREARRRNGTMTTQERAARSRQNTDIGYAAAHYRANTVLPRVCATADSTCKGRLELAFRHDAPLEYIRRYDGPCSQFTGRLYYVGPEPAEGYQRLCASHHQRQDRAAAGKPPGRRWRK